MSRIYGVIFLLICCIIAEASGMRIKRAGSCSDGSSLYETRSSWGAKAAKKSSTRLTCLPSKLVVIHHSETPQCPTSQKCRQRVKQIQSFHQDTRKWSDIGYNFLIGGDGLIYEGRGWDKQGAHAPHYNNQTIGICLIGDFTSTNPSENMFKAVRSLLEYATECGHLAENYQVVGHRQVKATSCPGQTLFNTLKTWPKWSSTVPRILHEC